MTDTRPESLTLDRIESPIGPVLIATDEAGALRALDFHNDETGLRRLLKRQYGEIAIAVGRSATPVRTAFERYFAGDIRALEGVPVRTVGTGFQRKVWAALQTIPAGETRSYGQIAAQIGEPAAVRAVGLANGANPIGMVIPCHRVIGADGSLTGFGGGLDRKRWLLRHEGARFKEQKVASRRLQPELQLG
jgi:methylated-DNA-[protein]-cysteine S-methyltransferase